MNHTQLTQAIAAAARQSFTDLLARHGDETFYAFALYTDEDCYTVVPAANSLERLDATLRDEPDLEPEERAYYRWASAEWAYEAYAAEPFNAICRQLSTACAEVSGDAQAFAAFKARVHAAMIAALGLLDGEGLFGRHRDAAGNARPAVLFITSSDHDEAGAMETRSARLLNSPEVCEAFLHEHPDTA